MKFFWLSIFSSCMLLLMQPANGRTYKALFYKDACSLHIAQGNAASDTIAPVSTTFKWGVVALSTLSNNAVTNAVYKTADNEATSAKDSQLSIQTSTSYILLNWMADEQQAINYYEIEYSTDGQVFYTGAVLFSDNKINRYTYKFPIKQKRNYFFRLKRVGIDKSITYSNTKAL